MDIKTIDSSPLKIVAEIFNINKDKNFTTLNRSDMSLLTEISNKKVILEFNWIEDLNIMISSFVIDDFDENILYHQLSLINNNLIIGNLRQQNNKSITYKHSLPLSNITEKDYMKKYLEDLLSEFNHLVTVLLKKINLQNNNFSFKNNKIVGHA